MKKEKRVTGKEKRCDERDNEVYQCTCVCLRARVYAHRPHRKSERDGESRRPWVQISGNETSEFRDACFARGRRERVTRSKERERKRE